MAVKEKSVLVLVFGENAQHISVVGRPVGTSTFLFAVFCRKTSV